MKQRRSIDAGQELVNNGIETIPRYAWGILAVVFLASVAAP
jgi:hypothetical protein